MRKNTYIVTMQPADDETAEPVELTVTAMLCDQVKAEREMRQRAASPEGNGIMFVSMMAWAALAREGRIGVKFDEFTTLVHDVSRPEAEKAAGAEGVPVDPTQPAASIDSV